MSKIFVAGHKGLVGSNIIKYLNNHDICVADKQSLDLRNQSAVDYFFSVNKPDYVFLCAAKVGGIIANSTYPAEFIYDNICIQNNVIHSCYKYNVKKLLFLGSSCIYPKNCPQPIKEEYLLSNYLEPTNEAYAIAKISGLKMCQYYKKQYGFDSICLMPTNLYGPGDNYHPENSHVIPGLINKFITAIENNTDVTLWGDGSPKREFLYVEDLAKACIQLMFQDVNYDIVNVGTGEDISILELAELIKNITCFKGNIHWDSTKPNGTPRKVLNIDRIKSFGWAPQIDLKTGLKLTLYDYINNIR